MHIHTYNGEIYIGYLLSIWNYVDSNHNKCVHVADYVAKCSSHIDLAVHVYSVTILDNVLSIQDKQLYI